MPRRGENIRKRKDGRWEGRYIKGYNPAGKAKYGSVYGSAYLDVKKKLNEVVKQATKNLAAENHDLTFREALFLWLQSNQVKLKDQTYNKYAHLIEKHILPALGQRKVKQIDAAAINQFVSDEAENGKLDGNGGLSPSYLQTICFIVASTLHFAAKEGYRSVAIGAIARPPIRPKQQKGKTLSHEEQERLERYLIAEMDERKLGALLSLRMGLRVGEVCGLRWEDVNFADQTIHIQHTVERIANREPRPDENKTRLALCDAKTVSSNRIIPIPSDVLSWLLLFKKPSGFLLPGNAYEYTDPRTFQNAFHKYLDACSLPGFHCHCLRHTFATRCVEAGVDVKSLSELLGHSSVNVTLNVYVHSSLEHKRRQMELVSGIRGQN